jgi:hypothetical protein
MTAVIFREVDNSVNVARQVATWTHKRAQEWARFKTLQFTALIVAGSVAALVAITAARQTLFEERPVAEPQPIIVVPADIAAEEQHVTVERSAGLPTSDEISAAHDVISQRWPAPPSQENAAAEEPAPQQLASLEVDHPAPRNYTLALPAKRDLRYLHYYVYSELPPVENPAVLVLASLKDMPESTPIEEIKRASGAFGLDFIFMKAIAKIESDFDPKQKTGSYIGLFQLSKYEFGLYGKGDILDARDNAVAAAYKFLAEAALFEWHTHKQPTYIDLYMIHQQGWQGAAEHVAHPDRIAWKSMCATDEGREKGEKWCKRAVWANTLPKIKQFWKSVDNLTSGAFVTMWRERIELFYSRYKQASLDDKR